MAEIKQKHSWEKWHRMFGHVGITDLQKMQAEGMVTGFSMDENSIPPHFCKMCVAAKMAHKAFPSESITRAEMPGEKTHSDLWGPYRTASLQGSKYYIVFIDDYLR